MHSYSSVQLELCCIGGILYYVPGLFYEKERETRSVCFVCFFLHVCVYVWMCTRIYIYTVSFKFNYIEFAMFFNASEWYTAQYFDL